MKMHHEITVPGIESKTTLELNTQELAIITAALSLYVEPSGLVGLALTSLPQDTFTEMMKSHPQHNKNEIITTAINILLEIKKTKTEHDEVKTITRN